MSDPAKSLRDRLDELSRPRLKKCEPYDPSSRRGDCEERAAQCYRAAVREMGVEWSVRKAAHDIERSVRMHLDYQSGSRSIPVDVVALLPERAQVAFLAEYIGEMGREARLALARACLDEIPEGEEPARVA